MRQVLVQVIKLKYVNGVNQEGIYGNAPTNATTFNVDGISHEIGGLNNANFFEGYMSHYSYVCDGYATKHQTLVKQIVRQEFGN